MTMEVLAAEFPDIFQQFIEIVPDPAKPDQPIYVVEEQVEPVTLWSVTDDGAKYEYEEVEEAAVVKQQAQEEEGMGDNDEVLQATKIIAATEPAEETKTIIKEEKTSLQSLRTKGKPKTSQSSVLMEHDYGQKFMVKDANKNNTKIISPLSTKHNPTKMPSEVSNEFTFTKVHVEEKTKLRARETPGKPSLDELDHLLHDLFYDSSSADINSNVQVQFDTERSAAGCSWSPLSSSCHHGLHCPFTAKILGLDQLQAPASPATSLSSTMPLPGGQQQQANKVHNVVVLKQTPEGLVRVQQSFTVPQHQFASFQSFKNQALRHQGVRTRYFYCNFTFLLTQFNPLLFLNCSLSQTLPTPVVSSNQGFQQQSPYPGNGQTSPAPSDGMPLGDMTNNGRMVYRPPPNSVVVKVPQPQQQPQGSPGAILCADCDSQFADNKSLVKHTRNQHQVYQCSKCGESTVGYYRMASHTKKKHSKEPVFFCNCGRNFSEKRGLTKHQNSCTFYNNS